MLPHTIKKHITRYIKRYNKSQYFKWYKQKPIH
jgi:hypothetical protein